MSREYDQKNLTSLVSEGVELSSRSQVAKKLAQNHETVNTLGPTGEYVVKTIISKDRRTWRYLTTVCYREIEIVDNADLVRAERSFPVDNPDTKSINFNDFAKEAAEQHLNRCEVVLSLESEAQDKGRSGKSRIIIFSILIVFVICAGFFLAYNVFDIPSNGPRENPSEIEPSEVEPTEIDPTEIDPTEIEPTEVEPPTVELTPTEKEQLLKIINSE